MTDATLVTQRVGHRDVDMAVARRHLPALKENGVVRAPLALGLGARHPS